MPASKNYYGSDSSSETVAMVSSSGNGFAGAGAGVLRTPVPIVGHPSRRAEREERRAATFEVHGIPVSPFTGYDHAVQCVRDRIRTGRRTFCVAINPEKVERARRDEKLRSVLLSANMHICDGVGVAIAAKLLRGESIPRITGVNLFAHLVQAAPAQGWRIFLLGASPESNAGARKQLEEQNPGIRIVGTQDGFFKDSNAVVEQINASGADILFVAMGSPRQEFWIAEHFDRLAPHFVMGVGGTFDVVSGNVRRAPELFCKTGTEWLYRLVTQPSRWRRQLVLPLFAVSTLRCLLIGK